MLITYHFVINFIYLILIVTFDYQEQGLSEITESRGHSLACPTQWLTRSPITFQFRLQDCYHRRIL